MYRITGSAILTHSASKPVIVAKYVLDLMNKLKAQVRITMTSEIAAHSKRERQLRMFANLGRSNSCIDLVKITDLIKLCPNMERVKHIIATLAKTACEEPSEKKDAI